MFILVRMNDKIKRAMNINDKQLSLVDDEIYIIKFAVSVLRILLKVLKDDSFDECS